MVFVRNPTGVEPRARGGRRARRRRRRGDRAARAPWSGSRDTLRAAGDGQRALARVPARPARRGRAARRPRRTPPTTSGPGARRCTGSRASTTRSRCAPPPAASTPRWRRPATARSASSTTSTTGPTGRPTRTRTRWRSPSPRRRVAAGLRDRPPPRRLPPRRLEPPADAGPAALLRPGRRRATSRASTRCGRGPTGAPASRSASPRTASARCRRRGSRRSPPTPTGTASSATCTRTSSRASSRSAAPSTASRRSSCSHRTGFLGPRTSLIHGIHVERRATSRRLAASDTIVVSCPTTEGSLGDGHFPALVYRDAGVRIAIGSDSNVRVDPFEETRELETLARRERRTRHALLAAYGDLWGELRRERPREPRACATPAAMHRPRPPGPGGRRRPPTSRSRSRPAGRPRSSLREPLHEELLLGGVVGERERRAVGVGGLGVAAEAGAAGRPSSPAGSGSRRGGRRAPAPRPRPAPAAGPSTIASATARLSATTGDGQMRSSSS